MTEPLYKEENDDDLVSNYIHCPGCKATLTQLRNIETLYCDCPFFQEMVLEIDEYDDDDEDDD